MTAAQYSLEGVQCEARGKWSSKTRNYHWKIGYENYPLNLAEVRATKRKKIKNALLPAGFEPATFALLQHPRRLYGRYCL